MRLSSCEPEQSGRRGENSRRHLAKSKQVTFRDGMGWCICRKFHSPSSTKLPLLPQMTVEQWTFLSAATGCARGNSGSLLRHPTRRRACTHDHASCQSRSMVRIVHGWRAWSRRRFFCRRFYFSFAYAKHAFSYWWGPANTELLGPERRLETGFDVMEMAANSSSDRRQVGRQKDPQRSSVTHGSKPLAGIEGRLCSWLSF